MQVEEVMSFISTVSEVLFAREADPEDVLDSLGFGGCSSLARIPARFLRHKSRVRQSISQQQHIINNKGLNIGSFSV